jgi:DNA-directed RNA polymerase subunit RPC12/RpoP
MFVCSTCAKSIVAWDEGDPYYRDANGNKVHVYHPSAERALATGIDTPSICGDCGAQFKSDSAKPRTSCRRCKSNNLMPTTGLATKPCPYCKNGRFERRDDFFVVS